MTPARLRAQAVREQDVPAPDFNGFFTHLRHFLINTFSATVLCWLHVTAFITKAWVGITTMKANGESYMNDLIFVGMLVAFFVIGGLYVHLCGKL